MRVAPIALPQVIPTNAAGPCLKKKTKYSCIHRVVGTYVCVCVHWHCTQLAILIRQRWCMLVLSIGKIYDFTFNIRSVVYLACLQRALVG